MSRIWVIFVLAFSLYACANAWGDPWVGQQGLRVVMIVLMGFIGLWLWSCLGKNNEDTE